MNRSSARFVGPCPPTSELSPQGRCSRGSARVNRPIIPSVPRRVVPYVRQTARVPARSARATAVLFAFGSLLTLVDALMTRQLLRHGTTTERWTPVRVLMDAVGVDIALAICAALAVGAMAIVAWGSIRERSVVSTASFVVL